MEILLNAIVFKLFAKNCILTPYFLFLVTAAMFCANNSKTIAFSKIFMGSKSVQHDEIYLWSYSEKKFLTVIRVMALLGCFLAFLMLENFKNLLL